MGWQEKVSGVTSLSPPGERPRHTLQREGMLLATLGILTVNSNAKLNGLDAGDTNRVGSSQHCPDADLAPTSVQGSRTLSRGKPGKACAETLHCLGHSSVNLKSLKKITKSLTALQLCWSRATRGSEEHPGLPSSGKGQNR